MKQLVIGYGNPLRSDDGLGAVVIQRLCDHFPYDTDVEFVAYHQLMPELVECLRDVDRVVFVDAQEGNYSGEVIVDVVVPGDVFGAFTHNVTPESLLGSVFAWYGHSPQGYIVAVTGTNFTLGETLSPEVEAALPFLLDMIDHLLHQPLAER